MTGLCYLGLNTVIKNELSTSFLAGSGTSVQTFCKCLFHAAGTQSHGGKQAFSLGEFFKIREAPPRGEISFHFNSFNKTLKIVSNPSLSSQYFLEDLVVTTETRHWALL